MLRSIFIYLSIRLGLAREFGIHAEPLPMVLDDALLKFDPTRQRNTVEVMLDFARQQQMLLLTEVVMYLGCMEVLLMQVHNTIVDQKNILCVATEALDIGKIDPHIVATATYSFTNSIADIIGTYLVQGKLQSGIYYGDIKTDGCNSIGISLTLCLVK
jgi:hypothetical protein